MKSLSLNARGSVGGVAMPEMSSEDDDEPTLRGAWTCGERDWGVSAFGPVGIGCERRGPGSGRAAAAAGWKRGCSARVGGSYRAGWEGTPGSWRAGAGSWRAAGSTRPGGS